MTATAARSAAATLALASAVSTVESMAALCASIASVGTTPPHCLQESKNWLAEWDSRRI